MLEIVSRMEAAKQNLPYYFTGKPCKHGHIALRSMQNGECKECRDTRFNTSEYREINKDQQAASAKEWATKPEIKARRALQAKVRRWLDINGHREKDRIYKQQPDVKTKIRTYRDVYRSKPEVKAKIAAYNRYYTALHPELNKWSKAKRYQAMLQATPPWVDKEIIALFYRDTPDGMQVDHIVPLQHKLVCGLHVMANLQYLSVTDNLKKHNKFNPEDFEVTNA